MSWEEAVRKLFQTHPRAVSSKTVIEAIKSASENTPTFTLTARDLASEQNRSWNLGFDRGVRTEQERIIKLLDTDFWHHSIWGCEERKCVRNCPTCELIALIKGENK